MKRLIQLSNGEWINPKAITYIRALERMKSEYTGDIFPARLVVGHGHQVAICACDDYAQAQEMANHLAGIANL